MPSAFKQLHCYPTIDHSGLELSALLRSSGLVSPAEFASMAEGIFPIALCGRSLIGPRAGIMLSARDHPSRHYCAGPRKAHQQNACEVPQGVIWVSRQVSSSSNDAGISAASFSES